MRESTKFFGHCDNDRGCGYMKIIHLQKRSWIPLLNTCLENSNHPNVILFCQRFIVTLSNMLDDDWYTALYCGETINLFRSRMHDKDPRWFLDWFPVTHIFRIAVFKYSGVWNDRNKQLLTDATRALEAGNAAWLSRRLPSLDYCHSLNTAHCGRRLFKNLNANTLAIKSVTCRFVSFEKIEGACMCTI